MTLSQEALPTQSIDRMHCCSVMQYLMERASASVPWLNFRSFFPPAHWWPFLDKKVTIQCMYGVFYQQDCCHFRHKLGIGTCSPPRHSRSLRRKAIYKMLLLCKWVLKLTGQKTNFPFPKGPFRTDKKWWPPFKANVKQEKEPSLWLSVSLPVHLFKIGALLLALKIGFS